MAPLRLAHLRLVPALGLLVAALLGFHLMEDLWRAQASWFGEIALAIALLVGVALLSAHFLWRKLRAGEQRLAAQSAALTDLTARQADVAAGFDERLRQILATCAATLDVGRVSLWRFTDDRAAIVCADLYDHAAGCHACGERLERERFPSYFAALERERVIAADDARRDARTAEFRTVYLDPQRIGAMLDVPVRKNDQTLGVLCVEHVGGPRTWTYDEQNFAVAAANLIVVAMADAERLDALARLEESEARARLILDSAHDAFIGMNSDGRITSWNAQAVSTFGWDREEALGQSLAELIIPRGFREAHEAGLRRFHATGHAPVANRRMELRALHREGHEFPIEITISTPMRADKGYFFGAFLRDISERLRHEEELRTAKEAAEAATRAKSEFLANMSHELRTPLNGVLGYAQLLQRDPGLSAAQREALDAISACGAHLLDLINDVLDLSKIEAGRMEVDVAPTDLQQVTIDLRYVVAERAGRKGLRFFTAIAPGVPRRLMLDGRHVRQVLLNLLGNAVKFTNEGEVRLAITAPDRSRIRFEVIDTGIGIEAEHLTAVFQAFRQTRAGAEAGGSGLGLTISQRLVKAMGGQLEVESVPGRGSRFSFELPLVAAPDSAFADVPDDAPAADARLAPGQELTALVADDSSVNRRIMASLLESAGVRVITAAGGFEAVRLAREHRPNIILMDLRMSDLDGFEATRRIHADPATAAIPVLAVTASAWGDVRQAAREAGCADFVPKPVRAEVLFAKLQRHAGVAFTSAPLARGVPAAAQGRPVDVRDIARRLRAAASIGDVTDLEALARELAASSGGALEIAPQVSAHAAAFDFDAIARLADALEGRP